MYAIDVNNRVSTVYVITLNERIIYWTSSSIYAPASAAFHALTEVYHGYRKEIGNNNWQWFSETDFECQDMFWLKHDNKIKYIDKRIATHEECENARNKLYYHL